MQMVLYTARNKKIKKFKNAVQTSTLRQDEVTRTKFTPQSKTTRKQIECIK